MQRLKIAQRELRSWVSDITTLRTLQPEEHTALLRIREAMALIGEAEMLTAQQAYFSDRLAKLLKEVR
jgi:hypothetical protein